MSIIAFIQDRARYYNCPVCGRSLRGCEVRMLNHVEDRFTVQVTCAACHVTFIVILAIQGQGVDVELGDDMAVEVELETVAESDLADKLLDETPEAAREPIEVDELLDVHLYLSRFEGSLTDLLKQPEPRR
jgi:hypothetical protein